MKKAIFNGTVLAESDETIVIEGNHYFPPEDVNDEYLKQSDTHTTCPWKGEASYYHIEAGGEKLEDGAWYYPEPKEEASEIKGYVAFYDDVEVE